MLWRNQRPIFLRSEVPVWESRPIGLLSCCTWWPMGGSGYIKLLLYSTKWQFCDKIICSFFVFQSFQLLDPGLGPSSLGRDSTLVYESGLGFGTWHVDLPPKSGNHCIRIFPISSCFLSGRRVGTFGSSQVMSCSGLVVSLDQSSRHQKS